MPRARRLFLTAIAFAACAAPPALAAPPPFGGLRQLSGTAGCVTEDGSGGLCADGNHLLADSYPHPVVSPDGRNVYYPADDSNAIAVFSRDAGTSALTQLPGRAGCIVGPPLLVPGCANGSGVKNPTDAAVSPDGTSVYVTSPNDNGIAVFTRDPATGQLSQAGDISRCVTKDGTDNGGPGACQSGRGLEGARSVALSPNGKNVYVASAPSNAVAVFNRDAATGALSQPGGTSGCVSEDGSDQGTPGKCVDGRGMLGAHDVTVSPDGANVYVASENSNAAVVFSRDTGTGALTQSGGTDGCVSRDGTGGTCDTGRALAQPRSVNVSPDGRNVYVASGGSNGVAVFTRSGAGALSQSAGNDGCVTDAGSETCAHGTALVHADDVEISGDGRSAYVAANDPTNALAVFSRDPATGTLTQLSGTAACLSDSGSGGACAAARRPAGAGGLTLAPDGLSLYAVGIHGLAAFSRELPPVCAATAQTFAAPTPRTVALHCNDPNGDPITRLITAGPAHGTLGPIDQGAGTVRFTPAAAFAGLDAFGFQASDGTLSSAPATATLTVAADTIAPSLTRVSVRPRSFRAAGRARKSAAKTGTTLSYTLSEAASVTIEIGRLSSGHRVGRKCVPGRGRRSCRRYRKLGRLGAPGAVGANRQRFDGRVRSRALTPGRYRATLTAVDAAGNRSKARHVTFTVTPRR